MRYLEEFGQDKTTAMRAQPGASSSDEETASLLHLSSMSLGEDPSNSPSTSDFEHLSLPSSSISSDASGSKPKARLIYCSSHVAIHPTQFSKDNVSGYLGVVEADDNDIQVDREGNVRVGEKKEGKGKQLLVSWVPNDLLEKMDQQDRDGYKRMEQRSNESSTGQGQEKDGYVMVPIPAPRGEKYAFSVPVSSIYSILVYPPSLTHWYGSATFNLTGGISLPTLFFHDDESPLLTSGSNTLKSNPSTPVPRARWGFPPFFDILQKRTTLLKSRLITGKANHNAELWLVNPSKADREVHEAGIQLDSPAVLPDEQGSQGPRSSYPPPKGGLPDTKTVIGTPEPSPRQVLLTGLSQITNFSRRTASQLTQQVMSHPLAQEVVPHLPPAVRSLVNAPGEWERSGRLPPKTGKKDVATEFESARVYLARWARVVAEEGEKARRDEVASTATLGEPSKSSSDDLTSSLGIFSILSSPNSKRPVPIPTRRPHNPITVEEWDTFAAEGRDELWVRREIFKRGFTDSEDEKQKRARREGWEMLLGIVLWSFGGPGDDEGAQTHRRRLKEAKRSANREKYEKLLSTWQKETQEQETDEWKEEWHRIDVDCRRTDRTYPLFAISTEPAANVPEKKDEGEPEQVWDGRSEGDEGGQATLNPHVAALRRILMTYHTYLPELGYVQGMSDLLSPIYVVLDADEADAFWGLVGVMKMMESNFLRDQSGMRTQLSTLQQLIGVMDPELYAHLERTGSLNLFFCFRWILIAFKREFQFNDVIRLWDVLWTNYYSTHFVLFVALAILQSHRDVILRYLAEFDEVLKYANNLSGTIELDSTLAQAEVLFLSFQGLVEDLDKQGAAKKENDTKGLRKRPNGTANGTGNGTGDGAEPAISPQLRDLLDGWQKNGGDLVKI